MARTRKRFWAWTLTLTAALLAVVWVGSMRFYLRDHLTPTYATHVCMGGVVVFRFTPPIPIRTPGDPFYGGPSRDLWDTKRWQADWLFNRLSELDAAGKGRTSVFIPLWPFVLLTGVPGVWMMVKLRKHTNPNACPACGYDRTGLPQSSTGPAPCPECGKRKDAVMG